MAKVYTKSELEALVKKTFKEFPDAKKAYATVDGNVFLLENRAYLHAGKKGTVFTFDNAVSQEEKQAENEDKKAVDVQPKAVEQIAAINLATTLDDLEIFKSDERATVVKALEAKTAELTANSNPTV